MNQPTGLTMNMHYVNGGSADGICIAEMAVYTVQAISIPWDCVDTFAGRPEASSAGVFFLFDENHGDNEPWWLPRPLLGKFIHRNNLTDTGPSVRIEHTSEPVELLHKYAPGNNTCSGSAIFLTMKIDSLTQAHTRWAAWQFAERAAKAGYQLFPENHGRDQPEVTEAIHAEAADIVETGSLLLHSLSIDHPVIGRSREARKAADRLFQPRQIAHESPQSRC